MRTLLLFVCSLIASSFGLIKASIFQLPEIPDTIQKPEARANYLISHFWDVADINNSPDNDVIEQSFVDFLSIFPYVSSPDSMEDGISNLLKKISNSKPVYSLVISLAEKYLCELDSPMSNDEYYILFINQLLKTPGIEESVKIRPRMQLELLMKNRVGSMATNFDFVDRNGASMTLYDIPMHSPYLLIFYDPDCGHCIKVMDSIVQNKYINELIETDKLKIVAIYSGEEKKLWDETKDSLPDSWIVGYDDGSINDNDIYAIRELPTVYLIGEGNIVYKKDIRDIESAVKDYWNSQEILVNL